MSNNDGPRKRKLEIKLHDWEEKIIREKFGRQAAEIARCFLLGHRVSAQNLTRNQVGLILRALAIHRPDILLLREHMKRTGHPKSAEILAREERLFNAIIDACLSAFSSEKKEA